MQVSLRHASFMHRRQMMHRLASPSPSACSLQSLTLCVLSNHWERRHRRGKNVTLRYRKSKLSENSSVNSGNVSVSWQGRETRARKRDFSSSFDVVQLLARLPIFIARFFSTTEHGSQRDGFKCPFRECVVLMKCLYRWRHYSSMCTKS